ncbi:hypothetical protein ACFCXR_21980 [Streptomyces noursei]|uniref:hypothetical protein n=1 Tax=Streptomyces TaxID=1883 RepID=UPI0035DF1954
MSPHQKKQIAKAIKQAEAAGFKVEEKHSGHTWGIIICCNCGERDRIFCTPRDADVAAKRIDEFVRKHQRAHA